MISRPGEPEGTLSPIPEEAQSPGRGFYLDVMSQPEALAMNNMNSFIHAGSRCLFYFSKKTHQFLQKFLPVPAPLLHGRQGGGGGRGRGSLSCTVMEPSGKEGYNHCMIFFALAVGHTYIVAFLFREMIMN